jgi:hypothetical protein
VEPVHVEQVSGLEPSRFPIVVLSDVGVLPVEFERKLVEHVRKGGAVFIAAGSVAALQPRIPVFGAKVLESRSSQGYEQRVQNAVIIDSAHPTVRHTTGLEAVKFYRTVGAESAGARVVARLTDQTPLVMEKTIGAGKVIYFASTFDNLANDFPLHPSFVPFIEQATYYLGGIEQRTSNLPVGSFLELRAGQNESQAIEVIGPDGKRAISLEEAAKAQNYHAVSEGFYELRRANQRTEMIAVNADRREADLAVVPRETLALWQNMGQGSQAAPGDAENTRKPWSLWWYVLLLVMAAASVESLLANRYLSIERGA